MIKFVTGRRKLAIRGFLFGPAGSGKTTAAADLDDPVFVSGEAGDSELDVKRYPFNEKTGRTHAISWDEVLTATRALIEQGGGKTVVFDGMTTLEQLCAAHVCTREKWASISTPGYGKGEAALLAEMRVFLKLAEELWAKGINVFFVAHQKIGKVKNPSGDEYQRFEPALTSVNNADVCGLFVGWCDVVMFVRPEVEIATKDKKSIGVSTGRRIALTREDATYIAKCRYTNVDALIALPLVQPMKEFLRQVAEGQDPALMRAKVERLCTVVDAETAGAVRGWLATPAAKDLTQLTNAVASLQAKVEGIAA